MHSIGVSRILPVLAVVWLSGVGAYAQDPYGYGPQPAQPVVPAGPPPVASTNVWTLLNQARSAIQNGQPQQALGFTEQFIRVRPLEPEGYFWQGVAWDNMMRTQQAVMSYQTGIQQVMKAGMDSAELRMNLGNDLLKLRRTDDAIEQYRRAVQIDPGLPLVYLNLGRALIEKGDVNEALDCFQRCEDLHFKPSQLAYYRAKAMIRAGRVADARAQVLMALSKINETSPLSQKLREEFSQVLSSKTE